MEEGSFDYGGSAPGRGTKGRRDLGGFREFGGEGAHQGRNDKEKERGVMERADLRASKVERGRIPLEWLSMKREQMDKEENEGDEEGMGQRKVKKQREKKSEGTD